MPIKKNKFIKHKEYCEIELYYPNTRIVCGVALISNFDLDKVKNYYWRMTNYGYAISYIKELDKEILLHKFITNTDSSTVIDHINRNKLDCRRENLREANKSINTINRTVQRNSNTGVKGVSYDKRREKYRAYAKINGRQKFLGYYNSLEEAKKAREDFEILNKWNIIYIENTNYDIITKSIGSLSKFIKAVQNGKFRNDNWEEWLLQESEDISFDDM